MNRVVEKKISELILILIGYFFVLIVSGIIKINLITEFLPTELKSSASVSGYVSLSVTCFISVVTISLILGVLYFCKLIFEFKVSSIDLIETFKSTILIFIIFELLKLLLALFLLENDLSKIVYDDIFIEKLKSYKWFKYDVILKYIMIICASVFFVFELYFKRSLKNFKELTIIFLIIVSGFYVSSTNFF